MLAVTTYDPAYVDACRARMATALARFDALAGAAGSGARAELDALEPVFFESLLLALENRFVHRLRKLEGKDGNPLNEVRLVCSALMEHDGRLVADRAIRLPPATSVLGLEPGDEVRLGRDAFARLAEAFLAEIERRYPPVAEAA